LCKAVEPLISYEISAHLQVMVFDYPRERIAKSQKVLALLTFCVSSTSGDTLESSSIRNRREPVGGQHRRANHRAKRIDGAGVQADARQETVQGRLGVLKVIFAIESPARFVDQIVAKIVHIRTGDGIVAAVGL
jgi:hypothetical protein